VSLGPDHDERLAAEAAVLARLRHPRIVRLERTLTIAGRPCLLLSLAGQSLQRELAERGTPSLDYASRYGLDLLSAVAHLEEQEVLHRDIKPANMGVGAVGKKSQRLHLFDFSLAEVALTELGIGTAAYRDPFLPRRGRWDAAADRYSAAVTLYELLTGQRPVLEADGAATLAAERFDPSVRAALVALFQTAFAAAVSDRHATAEDMRRAWERAFEAQPQVEVDDDHVEAAPVPDAVIAALPPTTPIQALPLSNRAKNALDRAGLLCAGDLRDLPQNRLSAMRGVGRQVAREILEFRERWERLAPTGPAASGPPFFPGYRGADLMVQVAVADLPAAASDALADAALHTLTQLAAAPRSQILALAGRNGFDHAALTQAISREHTAAQARNLPTTIAAWIDALLPAGKPRHHHARALFGLDGKRVAGVRELATALRVTTAAIYAAIGKSRAEWARHPAIRELVDEVHGVLDRAGGAMPLDAAGAELLTRIAHGDGPDPLVRATALIRVVVELDRDEPDGIRFVRLAEAAPWLLRREDLEAPLEQLGAAADELASREVLAGPVEAHRVLEAIVENTPLAGLAADRLIRLAAAASRRAAASSRLELYPRGMAARRALELSAAILPGKLTEARLRELVSARYPDAAPLPPRPELDELLEPFKLHYAPDEALYARPDGDSRVLHTRLSSYTRAASLPTRGPEIEARTVAIHEFEDKVRTCLERRALLVLGVSTERAPDAELALTRRFGLVPRSFDALFFAELERQMAAAKVQERVVYDTDAAGFAASAWPNLIKLARRTATALMATLLPPNAPLLLTQPGLIDRYQLVDLLRSLVEAAKDDAAEPILLLVPGHERGAPKIGDTVIPDLLPGQWTWIPKAWIGAQLQQAAG
jgi:hypothetical protein